MEKDILLTAGIQKREAFLGLLRMLAGRVGQVLDYSSFANDLNIDQKTVKDWVGILKTMRIIELVEPYSSNLSSRLIKSPKIYFLDTGLAVRLQGWSNSLSLLTSPQQGSLFENLVFTELHRLKLNFFPNLQIFWWRTKEGKEIDFIVSHENSPPIFIEAKVSPRKIPALSSDREFVKVFGKNPRPLILCHQEGDRTIGEQVPIAHLTDYLKPRFRGAR